MSFPLSVSVVFPIFAYGAVAEAIAAFITSVTQATTTAETIFGMKALSAFGGRGALEDSGDDEESFRGTMTRRKGELAGYLFSAYAQAVQE